MNIAGDNYKSTESFIKRFTDNAKVQFNDYKWIECCMLSDHYKIDRISMEMFVKKALLNQ